MSDNPVEKSLSAEDVDEIVNRANVNIQVELERAGWGEIIPRKLCKAEIRAVIAAMNSVVKERWKVSKRIKRKTAESRCEKLECSRKMFYNNLEDANKALDGLKIQNEVLRKSSKIKISAYTNARIVKSST